jgi:hemolysin III
VQGTVPPPHRTDALYDSVRDLQYAKPLLRGWLHLACFVACLLLGSRLVARSDGAGEVSAAAVYAISATALFGTSAVYHRGSWTIAWSSRLQRLDHAMIFMLIAGSATPGYLLGSSGGYRVIGLSTLWTLTLVLINVHLMWMRAPERLVGSAFLGLGGVAALSLPAIWQHAGAAPAALIVAGGALYITGALCYHRRRPDPLPRVFGYHEVFHACVGAAAACHYVAITVYIF